MLLHDYGRKKQGRGYDIKNRNCEDSTRELLNRYHQAKDRAFLLIAKVGLSGNLIFYDSMLPDGGCL